METTRTGKDEKREVRVKLLQAAVLLALAHMAGKEPVGLDFDPYYGLRALVA